MKNLYRLATQSVPLGSDLPLTASSLFVVDSNNSAVLYVASADSSEYGVFRVDRSGLTVAARLVSVPGEIVGLEHLALSDELCLATAAGEVMVVKLAGEDGGREPEEVTFCGGGLEAMGWSPEQEVVVFVDW